MPPTHTGFAGVWTPAIHAELIWGPYAGVHTRMEAGALSERSAGAEAGWSGARRASCGTRCEGRRSSTVSRQGGTANHLAFAKSQKQSALRNNILATPHVATTLATPHSLSAHASGGPLSGILRATYQPLYRSIYRSTIQTELWSSQTKSQHNRR